MIQQRCARCVVAGVLEGDLHVWANGRQQIHVVHQRGGGGGGGDTGVDVEVQEGVGAVDAVEVGDEGGHGSVFAQIGQGRVGDDVEQ